MIFELPDEYGAHVSPRAHRFYAIEIAMALKTQPSLLDHHTPIFKKLVSKVKNEEEFFLFFHFSTIFWIIKLSFLFNFSF